MKRTRRGLAWLLALLLLVSALPTAALAEEVPEEGLLAEETAAPAEPAGEVIYFSETGPVVVTTDASKEGGLDQEGNSYAVFDADASFTIPLPSWTEFPTAVDFRVGEQDFRVVFGNEAETNEIGGHVFHVKLEEDAAAEIPEDLYVAIDGQQVPVLPDGVATLSMLPLEETRFSLDLREYFPSELERVDISDLLKRLADANRYDSVTQDPSQVAAWVKYDYYDENGGRVDENDDYTIVGSDKTLNLANYSRYGSSYFTMELIIGKADPLNPENSRYIINVEARGAVGLRAKAYSTASPRAEIEIYERYITRYWQNGKETYTLRMVVNPKTWQRGQKAFVGLSLDSSLSGLSAKVYEGRYETAAALNGARDITGQILEQNDLSMTGGYQADCSYQGTTMVTLALTRESTGKVVLVYPVSLYMVESRISLNTGSLYKEEQNGERQYAAYIYDYDSKGDYPVETITLKEGYQADDEYYFDMNLDNPADNGSGNGLKYVKKAVVGYYRTEAQIPENAVDIKAQLFSDAHRNGGYKANFSNGAVFTVVDTEGGIHWQGVKVVESLEEPDPLSEDTYFRMQGAKGLNAYTMPHDSDSYYFNGFQTVLLLDGEDPVDEGSTILPRFWTGNKVDVRLGHNENGQLSSGEKQVSEESEVTFNNGQANLYSAAAENGSALKNYWVTFLTRQEGAKLFVNGVNKETGNPVREVLLTSDYNYHHDIFFANIGDEALTGLKVTLTDAQNIRLDDYWTIHEDGTTTLAPFTTINKRTPSGDYASYGELMSVSKIRLMPVMVNGEVQSGVVSGTLTISSDNGGEVKIKLTGSAGTPKIVTDTLVQGVKYVPYSTLIQANSMYGSNSVRFTATGLPSGLDIKDNGEIYGVPQTYGDYPITVTAVFSGETEASDTRSYVLHIVENTDENVAWATETQNQGYPFEPYEGPEGTTNGMIPDQDGTVTDQVFHSSGAYGEFIDLFLDGQKLTRGTDYVAENGSTKITVRSQTFQNAGNGGHTISAEFRSGGSKDTLMRRTASNFKISGLTSGSGSDTNRPGTGGSGSGNSGSGGSGIRKPGSNKTNTTKPGTTTTTPATPVNPTVADIMRDIQTTQWFFKDVDWAYQKGLMQGVSMDTYKPYDTISPATVVVVLARLNGADLTPWAEKAAEGVPAGQWYSAAASWAKENGMLPEGPFQPNGAMTRGQMAVVLVNYLKYLGTDCTLPAQPVAFKDAAQMTEAENAAFQVLYQFGIFKGVGNYTMNVSGSTTRAQFAVLIHRLSVFVEA